MCVGTLDARELDCGQRPTQYGILAGRPLRFSFMIEPMQMLTLWWNDEEVRDGRRQIQHVLTRKHFSANARLYGSHGYMIRVLHLDVNRWLSCCEQWRRDEVKSASPKMARPAAREICFRCDFLSNPNNKHFRKVARATADTISRW